MRLWHKDLITVLPRQQLISQWRECCGIARNIAVNGSPNHLLVNRIIEYPKWHFMAYTLEVCKALEQHGYDIDRYRFFKWFDQWYDGTVKLNVSHDELFENWHNDRYFRQCYYNLQEKYDCGGIKPSEWELIKHIERSKHEKS